MSIPHFLSHLPTFAGYPVAYVVFYKQDGTPDFRITDQSKVIECYENTLCAVCGLPMEFFWFIGGPQSMESGMFTDGPMHRLCADFSTTTCPFLNGKRQDASTRPIPEADAPIITNEQVPTKRSDKMAKRQALKYVLGRLQDTQHLIYQVTRWKNEPIWF